MWKSLPVWLRQGLLCTLCLAAGGVFAFGYSYRPLHGALTFKVQALEERIDARNRENLALRDEIGLLKSGESSCIEPEELEEVERELGRVRYALSESESSVERAERNLRDANANANRWRERFHELRDSAPATLPAAVPAAPVVVTRPSPAAALEEGAGESASNSNPSEGIKAQATPPRRPEPLFDAPFDDFRKRPVEASPKPSERGILLPSDTEDPF